MTKFANQVLTFEPSIKNHFSSLKQLQKFLYAYCKSVSPDSGIPSLSPHLQYDVGETDLRPMREVYSDRKWISDFHSPYAVLRMQIYNNIKWVADH